MLFIIASIIVVFIAYLFYDNYHIDFKVFEEEASFKLTVCQISDLHSRRLNIKGLVKKIKKINPDLILYTGDMVDGPKDNLKISLELIKALSIYPSFYVLGNHELRLKERLYPYLEELKGLNLTILGKQIFDYKGIKIMGEEPIIKNDISKISKLDADIVLAHNPEAIKYYKGKYIFSGHAHGGQFRLGKWGLYAPDQGLFPKYTKGRYYIDNKIMFVSAGLGGKDFRLRIFNPPHINVVRFYKNENNKDA